ncbi:MAG: NAD(P)/FAD-dependent oxidoreductase [Acidobacteriota bacterium]|nr:NAD(P)/FAD-dependent oxidoreductase [Acidobacteriota bacterium]
MERIAADIAVLGGGEAGLAAVVRASEMGARVVVVERAAQLGGACVFTGTLPSKVFSISAGVYELLRKIANFGIKAEGGFALDYKEVLASRTRITRCDQGVIGAHLRGPNVRIVRGEASLRDERHLLVRTPTGAEIEVEAPRLVLATGSRPFPVPGLPTDGRALLSTDELVDMPELPARMVIIGAGVIGCEYAFIFRTFGVEITLIEKLEHALPGQDGDIVAVIEKEMKRRGIRFLPGTMVRNYETGPDGRPAVTTGQGERIASDKVLVCVGRAPATAGLGLEAAGIALGAKGQVLADDRLRTSLPGVYAAGDVLGRWMLSATGILEGAVAAENALGGDRLLDERFVPSGIYTQPEIGSVGMTEEAAVAGGRAVIVGTCAYSGLVKACATYSFMPGLIKMIFDRGSHRLLGAHLVGSEAAELIHQLSLALRLGATAEDFAFSIYHHPSLSEGFREAARDALAKMK